MTGRTRERRIRGTVAALVACATVAGGIATAAGAPGRHRVELADGRKIEAIVVPVTECTWIVQSEDLCVEVGAADIRRVDGREGVGALRSRAESPVLRNETFERILPSGDVILSSSFARENRAAAALGEIEWGIAPHEVALLPDWKVFDEYGNELSVRVEERPDGARRARAALPSPVPPGGTLRFANRILFRAQVARGEDGVLRWRHRGDYPEDRLVTKLVRLPGGATIVSVDPEPAQRFEHDGAPYVLWRRYYVRGEERPLEVRYRLPAARP